jgi:hypothetical protein
MAECLHPMEPHIRLLFSTNFLYNWSFLTIILHFPSPYKFRAFLLTLKLLLRLLSQLSGKYLDITSN